MIVDVSLGLRKAYYNALNGAISVNGVTIPVYSEQVNGDMPNIEYKYQKGQAYIIMQSQIENESPEQNMCAYSINAYISIRIVTTFQDGGRKDITEVIANQVYNAIFDGSFRKHKLTSDEIYISDVRLEPTSTLFEDAGNETAYTKILTFNNIINL